MTCSWKHILYRVFNSQTPLFTLLKPHPFLSFPCSILIISPFSFFFLNIETIWMSSWLSPVHFWPLLVIRLSNSWQTSLPSQRTKTDLCSGYYKTGAILGYGWRELKPHNKDNIVPSPENSHKWDKLSLRGLISAWAHEWAAPQWRQQTEYMLVSLIQGFSSLLDLGTGTLEQGGLREQVEILDSLSNKYIYKCVKKQDICKF